MKRQLKNAFKRGLFRTYKLGTRLGVHIIPVHYYSPLPDIVELEATRKTWAGRSALPGLAIDLDEQVANLRAICLPFQHEYALNTAYHTALRQDYGPGYGYVEAQALHAVIRHFKPKRIIEVGSGISTLCMRTALELNRKEGEPETLMTCIEPFPSRRLKKTPGIALVQEQVQAVSANLFTELTEGDFLFIDSSHTVKPGSDVNYLVLDVLPRLNSGVLVHFHDIFLPYDYQRNVLKTFLHWAETSLVRAFLTFNNRVEIVLCLSMLHYDRQGDLREVFPDYDPQSSDEGLVDAGLRPFEPSPQHFPSSLYLRTR